VIVLGMVAEGRETLEGKEEGPHWHSPWIPRNSLEIEVGMVAWSCRQTWSTWGN
jgi:hypothetical protein